MTTKNKDDISPAAAFAHVPAPPEHAQAELPLSGPMVPQRNAELEAGRSALADYVVPTDATYEDDPSYHDGGGTESQYAAKRVLTENPPAAETEAKREADQRVADAKKAEAAAKAEEAKKIEDAKKAEEAKAAAKKAADDKAAAEAKKG